MNNNEQTKAVLAAMFTENTGRAMCDSGDYYGRSWQQNQGKTVADFEKEPEAKLHVSLYRHSEPPKAELLVTVSAYHFLKDRLSFEEWLQRAFDAYVAGTEAEDDAQNAIRPYSAPDRSWFTLARDFIHEYLPTQHLVWEQGYRLATPEEILATWGPGEDEDAEWQLNELRRDLVRAKVRGPFGEGDRPMTVNTCNGEDALSQVVQYTLFQLGEWEEVYVALFVHGGCDVRGGYTAPKFFSAGGRHSEWTGILDNSRYTVGAYDEATGVSTKWDYEGGGLESTYHELLDRRCTTTTQLSLDEVLDLDLKSPEQILQDDHRDLDEFPVVEVEALPAEPEKGVLYINEEANIAWCPFSHQPLEAWGWPAG